MSESDYLLVLTPSELDTVRESSARYKREGFDGLQKHTDNLRDKISNMMIDQTYARIDNKSSV
jgi:hypothetical protein